MEGKQLPLPKKTRIAAKWMRYFGIFLVCLPVLIVVSILPCFGSMSGCPTAIPCYLTFLSPGVYVLFQPSNCLDALPWLFTSGILLISCSRFLFKRKKWGWIFSVVLLLVFILLNLESAILPFSLTIELLGDIKSGEIPGNEILSLFLPMSIILFWSFFFYMPYLVPLILLFADRKNFFKIAS